LKGEGKDGGGRRGREKFASQPTTKFGDIPSKKKRNSALGKQGWFISFHLREAEKSVGIGGSTKERKEKGAGEEKRIKKLKQIFVLKKSLQGKG